MIFGRKNRERHEQPFAKGDWLFSSRGMTIFQAREDPAWEEAGKRWLYGGNPVLGIVRKAGPSELACLLEGIRVRIDRLGRLMSKISLCLEGKDDEEDEAQAIHPEDEGGLEGAYPLPPEKRLSDDHARTPEGPGL